MFVVSITIVYEIEIGVSARASDVDVRPSIYCQLYAAPNAATRRLVGRQGSVQTHHRRRSFFVRGSEIRPSARHPGSRLQTD